MWLRLLLNSFRRDSRRKVVAIAAVMLATCLATFLLNWALNLGDKIQSDLRAYGANILILPVGETLPLDQDLPTESVGSRTYLQTTELKGLTSIFWENQIVAYAPVLEKTVKINESPVRMIGSEFGAREARSHFEKTFPYLKIQGRWPKVPGEIVVGSSLAKRFGLSEGSNAEFKSTDGETHDWRVVGVVQSGGAEEEEVFGLLSDAQLVRPETPDQFSRLMVSAMTTPVNALYKKYVQNPDSLTPQEYERYSCTPYPAIVANEISQVFGGSEYRIVRQISQNEEKIAAKVNWLMVLITLAALVAASLTMTSTTTAMILERRRELALMKAIGSHDGFLVLYLFGEVLLIGLAGSVAGFFAGSLLAVAISTRVFETSIVIKPMVLPVTAVLGILIITIGCFWPLRSALRVQPAETLRDL